LCQRVLPGVRVQHEPDLVVTDYQLPKGSAARMLKDPELYDNVNAAMKELKTLIEQIRKDPRKYLRVKLSLF
jgi:phospholipid/cholesterol/gamma-HCH transport system substrate-binding protein